MTDTLSEVEEVKRLPSELRDLQAYRRRVYEVQADDVDVALGRAATALDQLQRDNAALVDMVEQKISAWAFAHDIDGAVRNDLIVRIRTALLNLSDTGGE